MWENGLLRPTVFDRNYRGLESVTSAMKDLSIPKGLEQSSGDARARPPSATFMNTKARSKHF